LQAAGYTGRLVAHTVANRVSWFRVFVASKRLNSEVNVVFRKVSLRSLNPALVTFDFLVAS
jgi:hypothetical protein